MARATTPSETGEKATRTRRSPAEKAQADLDKAQANVDKSIKRRDKAEAEFQAARDEVFRAQRFLDYARANPDLPVQDSVIEPMADEETRELERASV